MKTTLKLFCDAIISCIMCPDDDAAILLGDSDCQEVAEYIRNGIVDIDGNPFYEMKLNGEHTISLFHDQSHICVTKDAKYFRELPSWYVKVEFRY